MDLAISGCPSSKPLLGWEEACRDLHRVCLVEGPADLLALRLWDVPRISAVWDAPDCADDGPARTLGAVARSARRRRSGPGRKQSFGSGARASGNPRNTSVGYLKTLPIWLRIQMARRSSALRSASPPKRIGQLERLIGELHQLATVPVSKGKRDPTPIDQVLAEKATGVRATVEVAP